MKPLTPEQFASLFPKRPFAVRRIERGHGKDRGMVWCAHWGGYFTSDTDRLVDDVASGAIVGDSADEALGALAQRELDVARERVAGAEKLRAAEREKLAALCRVLEQDP